MEYLTMRGGDFYNTPSIIRVSFRHGYYMQYRSQYAGIRMILV